jgi:sugar lactone lactonase YvrE
MQIGEGNHAYRWHDRWAQLPDTPSKRNNGRTHALAVLDDGRIVVFAQMVPGVMFFDADGKLVDSWGDRFVGAHGLTKVRRDGREMFWLADQESCEVCRTTLHGELDLRLDHPPADQRPDGKYMPTWVDEHPETGEVWVADGYGGGAIHRYEADGQYLGRLTGDEGAGRFNCPHAVRFGPDGRAFIADRGNHRIAVYDAAGSYLTHNDDATHSPCGFDFHDGLIVVPELVTGVKLLDAELNVVAELGASDRVGPDRQPEGWPNLAGTEHVRPGQFNSPHGACFAPNGDLYVGEFIVGGRVTRLEKIGS